MILTFDAHVIGGVEVEEEELLAESHRTQQLGHVESGLRPNMAHTVQEEGKSSVYEESHGDRGVLEVVEMVGRDGAVGIERLVLTGADEELHGH